MNNVFIGGAWPYANGELHVGRLSALLPGDVIARYHRKKGDRVLYVSGSDCHGTPIAIRAKTEGVSPKVITNQYHASFQHCFEKLGFSYDLYTRTDDDFHKNEVKSLIRKLYEQGYIDEKQTEQVYCTHCQQFLPDRFVEGICPVCGNVARGDQCDHCQSLLDPIHLKDKKCKTCGHTPIVKPTKQLYFALSRFEKPLKAYVKNYEKLWRPNARNTAHRYIDEGLQDRAITRDLPWGIDVPIPGYENKKIYVWIDAVLGYLTASKKWAEAHQEDYRTFWNEQTITYYNHGKDNIPFHNVILPALLLGLGIKALPQRLISSEYVTLEGKKLSTSNNWVVWVNDLIRDYDPDVIRYSLLVNGPEKRDADFSERELITLNNADLVGAYGNLVNRTLVFLQKRYGGQITSDTLEVDVQEKINDLYPFVGSAIEKGECKAALKTIFNEVRWTNKYFDTHEPWKTFKTDPKACYHTLYQCLYSIINLANLLEPFLPFSTKRVQDMLKVTQTHWAPIAVSQGTLATINILFNRLETKH